MSTASVSAPTARVALAGRLTRPGVVAGLLAFAAITPVAAGQGGFYPVSWGWMGIAYAWAGGLAVLLRGEIRLTRAAAVVLGGAVLLTVWTAATLLWTTSTTDTVYEIERMLAYLTFVAALLLICERGSALGLVVGTWAAIVVVACYSLATRLAPARFRLYVDPVAFGRLFQPIGYWNALGAFCAMGIAIALGLADRQGGIVLRALAAASVAPLAATTYFTFSRGAWLSLALGFAAVVTVSPARLRYLLTGLCVLPAAAAGVAYAASQPQLTAQTVRLAAVGGPGQRAALAIGLAAVICGAAVTGLALAQRRVRVPGRIRTGFAWTLVAVSLLAAGAAVAHYGSPISATRRAYDSVVSKTPPPAQVSDLNNRLLSLSLHGRLDLWRSASQEFRAHPVAGGGAGTYGAFWLAHRPILDFAEDAHSLYLEMLAELGIVGLVLLLALLGPPLVIAVRHRHSPLIPVAVGAYVVYLTHAAADWDWEVVAVTLVALTLGVAILLCDRDADTPIPGWVRRVTLGGLIAAGVLAGLGLVANRALSNGASALASRSYAAAIHDANQAHRFAPWSDAPYILAGRANLSMGRVAEANRQFASAIRKDPTDWVAWRWRMQVTIGAEHTQAVARLKALDPRYDFLNGRP